MRVETIGPCTLYLGDCLEILPTLEAGSVDAVVADPPYGTNNRGIHSGKRGIGGVHVAQSADFYPGNLVPIKNDDKPIDFTPFLRFRDVILWGGEHLAYSLPRGRFLAWDKDPAGLTNDSFSDVEFAWWNRPGAARIYRHLWKGLCQGPGHDKNKRREHPMQKPVEVMQWCIRFCKGAETIRDPFMGSGTTGVAAIKEGRRFIGIEIDEHYFDIACKRIQRAWDEDRSSFWPAHKEAELCDAN